MAESCIPSEAELEKLLKKTFTSSLRPKYITVKDFLLPKSYFDLAKDIKEFEVRDSDIWICGFPKTGTTWISEIAWLIANDLDYEGAKEQDFMRTGILDFGFIIDTKSEELWDTSRYLVDSVGFCRDLKDPRQIKSHLPACLLPEQILNGSRKNKVIYTFRCPMDTCVSYFHQCKNYEKFTGTIDDFCKLFLHDKINYGPYDKHVKSFWELKDKLNFLIVSYEEMNRDVATVIRKVAKFLGKVLTEEEITELRHHVSFDEMKKNPAVNKTEVNEQVKNLTGQEIEPFIRKGKIGGYEKEMPKEYIPKFKYWMRKRFEGTGIDILNL